MHTQHPAVGELDELVVVFNQGHSWCILDAMTRITVDVNDEWLEAARAELGTETKVATINAALHAFAVRRKAADIVAAFNSVQMDFDGADHAWGYNGGRNLSHLAEDALDGGDARGPAAA